MKFLWFLTLVELLMFILSPTLLTFGCLMFVLLMTLFSSKD